MFSHKLLKSTMQRALFVLFVLGSIALLSVSTVGSSSVASQQPEVRVVWNQCSLIQDVSGGTSGFQLPPFQCIRHDSGTLDCFETMSTGVTVTDETTTPPRIYEKLQMRWWSCPVSAAPSSR
jgi:hypothetical protein